MSRESNHLFGSHTLSGLHMKVVQSSSPVWMGSHLIISSPHSRNALATRNELWPLIIAEHLFSLLVALQSCYWDSFRAWPELSIRVFSAQNRLMNQKLYMYELFLGHLGLCRAPQFIPWGHLYHHFFSADADRNCYSLYLAAAETLFNYKN